MQKLRLIERVYESYYRHECLGLCTMNIKQGYKQTEIGIIPEDWEVGKLENFFSFISYGFTNPMPSVDNGIYMIAAADINHGKIQYDSARSTTETAYQQLLSPKSKPKKNDVLLTKDGSLGRLALVEDEKICINQSVAVIRPNNKVNSLFLKLLLESSQYQRKMLDDAGGSTIKHIYITIVNLMTVAVPVSLPEQTAIATALSDIDALIGELDKLIAKKQGIKQATMQQLLTGKKRLAGFSGEWEVKRLGDVFVITAGGDLDKKNFSITKNEKHQFPVYSNSLSNNGLYGYSPTYSQEKNTITVTARGTVGFANARNHKYSAIGRVLILSPLEKVSCFFVAEYINNKISFANESTGVPQLTAPQISKHDIVIPSYEEQTAIANILSDMDAEISQLEGRRAKMGELKQGMMQELLTGRIRLI